MRAFYMRRRGVPLVLSFLRDEDMESFAPSPLELIASTPVGLDEAFLLRSLSDDLLSSLRRWRQERRYIPRLLVSALAFLLLYLFFSLVLLDPVPMVDELLFSFLGAGAAWIIMSRADERSSFMKGKMEMIEDMLDSYSLVLSGNMAALEEYYDGLYSYSPVELASMIASGTLPTLPSLNEGWKEDFSSALLSHLRAVDSGIDHTLRRIESDHDRERTAHFLVHQVSVGSLDLLDLALYQALGPASFQRKKPSDPAVSSV